MRFQIRYQRTALQDLETIIEYIKRESPERAQRLMEKIDYGISRLSRFPLSGSKPRDLLLQLQKYRILVIEAYLVFYRIRNRVVLIQRILHGKREYAFLF